LSDPAIEVGRLVALLRGEGLTERTVRELLRPESVAKLRGILTDRSFPEVEDCDPTPVESAKDNVLAFKAREAVKP
jgi:hypothetical protein